MERPYSSGIFTSLVMYCSVAAFWVILSSCNKDRITISSSLVVNQSGHAITVNAYREGVIQPQLSATLNTGETREIYRDLEKGSSQGAGYPVFAPFADSIVVTFDNTYSIAHYKISPIGNRPKFYPFTSARNLYNGLAWSKTQSQDENDRKKFEFRFTFTETDYNDAK